MKAITVNTKLIGLLGMPLGQSFAPTCQNGVYQDMGWDMYYFPIEIPNADDFGAIVNGIRRMNFAGFAVTKPYKVTIMQYLDEVDDLAGKIGSCNTVVLGTDGRLKGYNTDGVGAIRSMQEEGGVTFKGNTFFSFGAGGTGKSVCFEIASRGPKRLYITDPTDAGRELVAHINKFYPGVCSLIDTNDTAAVHAAVREADVVLNLSGLGMAGKEGKTPVDKAVFRREQLCFDATYNPVKTRFLQEAEEAGCRILNGLGMMVYQGTRQMNIWTGNPEPVDCMKKHLQEILKTL